jgi:predicted DCC family thiol-disulfide oxidoreductase YuxK
VGDGEGVIPHRVFYDGDCGLCAGAVRFLLRRGDRGLRFRFAPLQGETFGREIPEAQRAALPDSLVVRSAEGRVLTRSRAVVFILRGLGGGWAALGALLWLVPRPLRDLGYRAVAAVRRRLFPLKAGACPWADATQRARFDP